MYIEDAYNSFLDDRRSFCAVHTIDFYEENLTRFISFLATRDISEIDQLSQDVLKQYLLFLRSRNVKNTTIRCYFRAINAFCFYLIDQELVPYFRYKLKMPRPDQEPVLPLTQSEADLVIETIKQRADPGYLIRDLLIFRLMIDMGLRSSEVLNLKKKHIQGNVLVIQNSKFSKSRILPIPPAVSDLLLEFIQDKTDPLFDMTPNALKSFFQKLKRRTGIIRIHAHLLRHTFATSYMLQRGNLEFCRVYLGHEDYTTTKVYVNLASQCMLTNYDIYSISDVFK